MSPAPRRVVLVGGGHAHVHVLRRWGERPPRGAEVVAVLDEADEMLRMGFIDDVEAIQRDARVAGCVPR